MKRWHFAHEASQERPECFAGAVNLLRRLAIEVLQEQPHLELPVFRKSVSTKAPLPSLMEIVECRPAQRGVLRWEERAGRDKPVAMLELAGGAQVRLFVEAGSSRGIRLAEFGEGSLLFTVPLPPDAVQLNDLASAKGYIAEVGVFEWHRLPDADPLIAETLQRLEQRAKALVRVREETEALHRIRSSWAPPQSVDETTLMPSQQPRPQDASPWTAWRKPRSSYIFYGLTDGSAWLLVQHVDGRSLLMPWPKTDEGWDEQLPARLGVPDPTLGGMVLSSEVNTMIYLRARAKTVQTSSDWADIVHAATPFR